MKPKINSKIIKRPKNFISHKRQHFVTKFQMAAAGDLTMTPTSSQQKKIGSRNLNSVFSTTSFSTRKHRKRNVKKPKVPATKIESKHKANYTKSSLKEVDASKRKRWVYLNKKQTDFFSNIINASVSFAMSQTDTESTMKFEALNSCLHATKSILMQKVKNIKVPSIRQQSTNKTSSISKVMYTNISEKMDATIHSLTEAINKEKMIFQKKKDN